MNRIYTPGPPAVEHEIRTFREVDADGFGLDVV